MALRDILTHIRSRLSQNRKLYVQSEAAVRDQLIAPVLKELGWDTTNPDRVRPEYTVGKNRVDWALFKGDRPVLFIEAKTVTTLDEASTVQLGNYCYQESVEFGVITNGKIWRFLKTYEPGKSVQERVFWEGDVEQDVNRVLTGPD